MIYFVQGKKKNLKSHSDLIPFKIFFNIFILNTCFLKSNLIKYNNYHQETGFFFNPYYN